jgi:hypothetical protein
VRLQKNRGENCSYPIAEGATFSASVIAQQVQDRGGGLVRVDGRIRLIEGLTLPSEETESLLSWYNSATYWMDIDQLLTMFGLSTTARNRGLRAIAPRN